MSTWMQEVMGLPVGDFVRKNPRLAEDVRSRMLAGIAQVRSGPPPRSIEHWGISERFQGIQGAGLVVVNIRSSTERPAAEQLLVDLARLRKDDALFSDILGTHGGRRLSPVFAEQFVRRQGELPSVASGCTSTPARRRLWFVV